MNASIRSIILYMRPGCHLCEEVEDLLLALAREQPLALTYANILDDPELYERYKHAIPVVAVEDGPTLFAPIDEAALRAALGARSEE